jgi:hypothetical protein
MDNETQPRKILENLSKNFYVKCLLLVCVAALFFGYGAAVGRYEWRPFRTLKLIQDRVSALIFREESWVYPGEEAALHYVFWDPIINTEKLYDPISSLDGLKAANRRIFMSVDGFDTAYEQIVILQSTQIVLDAGSSSPKPVIKVTFEYQSRNYNAYAYGVMPSGGANTRTSSLIIPGSGYNESGPIASNDQLDYHYGILDALRKKGGDVFVYVKPNEDFLAWHDGKKKVYQDYFLTDHINRGGSYSGSYLVMSMAVAKFLKGRYEKLIIAGLSQGGAATLLNAIQSEPDIAIIASGYSSLNEKFEENGPNQILGVRMQSEVNNGEKLREKLRSKATRFLFTWGLKERWGFYEVEANEKITAGLLNGLPNVWCEIHDGGHRFPKKEINKFLDFQMN